LYALAKLSSEIIIQSVFNSVRNIHFTNIRLAGLVGKELKDRITNKFINNAINGKPLNITGGKQQFSYLDVHDAADGIIALLKTPPEVWKTVYNLGYLKSYGILEIAELVTQVAKKFNCPEVKINLNKADGSLHAEIDSTLFYNDTNWKPMYDMKATIDSIFRYELEHKIKELEL
jgi:nucleoside-diphosphate-sugar epimerase